MSPLLDKRLVIVAGKGGVGRTTVAMALGRLAASRGRRTLVCLCNAASRYSHLVGDTLLGAEIRELHERLAVVNLEPRASEEEYALQILHNRVLHRLIFGSEVVRSFLDAVPGLAEWAVLGKATHYALDGADRPSVFDLVIFDSPATGHGLDILTLPRAIVASVPSGRMREEALARVALMTDVKRCEVLPVTLPEEMPVNETAELVTAVRRIDIAVKRVIVNMVEATALTDEMAAMVASRAGGDGPPPWLLPAAVAAGRRRAEKESLERLAFLVPLPQIELPRLRSGPLDEGSLVALSRVLGERLDACDGEEPGL